MADTLDTKAADQFQPVHRSGHGAITFEGREYTRLEWIERTARNGGTLAAGEGAVLCAEIDRLRGQIAAVMDLPTWYDDQTGMELADARLWDTERNGEYVKSDEILAALGVKP
jgi:hypothetical protein